MPCTKGLSLEYWTKTDSPTVYQWLRLNFGDKPAHAIATNAISNRAKLSQAEFPEAAKEFQDHVYVGGIGGSRETTAKAKQLTNDIDTIPKKGRLQIKAWHSNETEIDESKGERNTDLLGLRWYKQTDKFTLKKNELGQLGFLTKRRCLGLIGQLWGPIGLMLPVAIKFRVDLQELWSSGYDWDEILPGNIQSQWKEIVKTMDYLLAFEFDRKLKPSHAIGVPQVHGFCDGGKKACRAVLLLHWELIKLQVRSCPDHVLCCPVEKEISSTTGTNGLFNAYKDVRHLQNATTVRKYPRFQKNLLGGLLYRLVKINLLVSARVVEIQESVGVDDVRYIWSKSNPSSHTHKRTEPSRLTDWLEGPSFL